MPDTKKAEILETLNDVQEQLSMFSDLLLQFTDKATAEVKNSTLYHIGEHLDDCNLKLDAVHNKIITA